MLCSNCRIIEISSETQERGACENGHFLCGNCRPHANDRCMLCDGLDFDSDENAWVRLQSDEVPNWTEEMIRDWSRQNRFVNNESMQVINGESCDRSEECDAASMNLLYSRGEAYAVDSPQQSDSVNISDSKWNQRPWKDMFSKEHDFFSKSSLNLKPMSQRFVRLGSIENRSTVAKKDTRQTLVDQTKEEIREKIMEEIFKSFKNDPRSHIKREGHAYVKQFQTIGVSTESTPRLLPEEDLKSRSHERSHESVASKKETNQFKETQEFLVMNVDTSGVPNPQIPQELKKKNASSCIDLKLQQIMGTILESVTKKPDESADDQYFYKFIREKFSHMPLKKLEEIISSIHSHEENTNLDEVCQPSQSVSLPQPSIDLSLISNSRRAVYNPPVTNQPEVTPSPQFQLISLRNLKVCSELQQMEIIDASTLNIPRSPVICPISSCKRAFFVSDFTKHIAVDHTKVPMARILPRICKNFFLDPKLIHFGVSRCQLLLLVKDKIRNLGHEKFKDFIPILVMTTKVSLLELCCSSYRSHSEEVKNSTQNFIMIWLTGIMPPQLPIFFSMTVWARTGFMPTCHIVHSGRLYSVRNSQSPEAVRNSGQMLLLSENQIDLLTNRGRHMLELQISVH